MVTLVHEQVQPDQCVMSGGLLLLVMNLIGLRLGPTHVGASDVFHATHPKHSLQIALYTLAPFNVLGVALLMVSGALSSTEDAQRELESNELASSRICLERYSWMSCFTISFILR